MSMKRVAMCGMVLLGVLVVGVAWILANDAKPNDASPFTGAAMHISLRVSPRNVDLLIEQPEIKVLREHVFLVGLSVGAKTKTWIPLSDVQLFEEFADAKEMAKFYRERVQGEKKSP